MRSRMTKVVGITAIAVASLAACSSDPGVRPDKDLSASGTVMRINKTSADGVVYFMLKDEDRTYSCYTGDYPMCATMIDGDNISLTYDDYWSTRSIYSVRSIQRT